MSVHGFPPPSAVAAHRVTVRLTPTRPGRRPPVVDRHLRVTLPAPPPWPLLADVLVAPGPGASAADDLAAAHPGAAVVAVHQETESCWLRLGPYGHAPARLILNSRHMSLCPWPTWASLAHAWLSASLAPAEWEDMTVRMLETATGMR
ncbi:hypothetical protein [Streptomyces regalis]|uniref:Uncharacterized protein n=1 Tax=Streptomyces regalis TaxID=68262 RepID=A0A101JT21_9ACTN|nr:hypothetical protein [Streptomyces regalis]KUL32492.1 hypothetical protein ADL12_22785 [Streptomyces regalis]